MNQKAYLSLMLIFYLFLTSCSENVDRPNVILINIDDLGWNDVGYMGTDYYNSPHIDQLAEQGMIFANGYATASNCAPSRASLMTGLWTPRHGIYTVNSSERGQARHRKLIPIKNKTTLATEFVSLPVTLQDLGYSTCHAGKWHLGEDPITYGFDVNIGGGPNGHPSSYYPPYGNVALEPDENKYLTDLIMSKTIDFIKENNDPFFLHYSPYAVHTPIHPVDSLKYKYENKDPFHGQNNIDYATMIENLDRNIGLLIATLVEKDLMDKTLIIFTSDNGGLYGITDQFPLRAGKGSYYEGGIRVPFFFVWKGRIAVGEKNENQISNLDIFPTILEAVGENTEGFRLDGQSLIPLLTEDLNVISRPLFWHFPIYLQAYKKGNTQNRDTLFRTRPGSVVRFGKWKLHHYFEDGGIELYDLEEDVGEKNDLSRDNPEKVKELMTLLDNWRKEVNAPIPNQLNPEWNIQQEE